MGDLKFDLDFLIEGAPSLLDSETSPNYFDTLPDDVLARVAKLARSRINYVSLLFDQVSPFRRVSPSLFKTLHLNDTRRLNFDIARGIIECGRGRDWKQMKRLIRICGPHITRVELHSASLLQPIGPYAHAIRRACPNVTALCLRGEDGEDFSNRTVEDFIIEFHGMVVTLDLRLARKYDLEPAGIVGENALDHVATFEKHRIKSFTYRGDSAGHLVPFFYAVRATLEEVHIEFLRYGNWNDTIIALRDHCRELKVIMLDNPLRGSMVSEELFASLFLSYGGQLQRALLHSLGVEHCRQIAARCVNLHAEVIEKRHQFDRLSALGQRIDSLFLRVKSGDKCWRVLGKAMKSCSNITTLKIYRKQDLIPGTTHTIRDECIKRMFSRPMPRLERLTVSGIHWNFSLDYIAKHTCQLREFRLLRLSFLSISYPAFFRLVENNPFLEVVQIDDEESRRKESETNHKIWNLFQVIKQCKRLQSFELQASCSVPPDQGLLNAICLQLNNERVRYSFVFQKERRRCPPKKRRRIE